MACMEHICVECDWSQFDNAPRTSCPKHGPESSRHHFDEPEYDMDTDPHFEEDYDEGK